MDRHAVDVTHRFSLIHDMYQSTSCMKYLEQHRCRCACVVAASKADAASDIATISSVYPQSNQVGVGIRDPTGLPLQSLASTEHTFTS